MIKQSDDIMELVKSCPVNAVIVNNIIKAWSYIRRHDKILVGLSGGSDSDICLDIVYRCAKGKEVYYYFMDTGVEYNATKEHLKQLEEKYNITIHRFKAQKSIPTCCKEYGQPFISKQVSEFISRLQKHNFTWTDEPFEVLIKKFPKCKSALSWWCCKKGDKSKFDIARNKYLKQFLIANPPTFKISAKCCEYAKKNVAHKVIKETGADLSILGLRQAEGGARGRFTSCYSDDLSTCDSYRPVFWYKSEDKKQYAEHFGVIHSGCYRIYGLRRTGCVGCPFGQNIDAELEAAKKYEPLLYQAMTNIFKDSYDYTRKYKEFVNTMKGGESL